MQQMLNADPSHHTTSHHISSHSTDDQSRHSLFLAPDHNLTRYARFGGICHADVGDDSAASDGLAEKFECMCGGVDRYIGAFERLQ